MRRTFLPMALAGLLAPAAWAQPPDPAPHPPEFPSITVMGSAEARAAPDVATVRLGVTRDAGSARPAQDQVSAAMQKIVAAITGAGVAREQIRTAQLTLLPIYGGQRSTPPGEAQIIGYRATNTVSVRLEKLSLVGAVIDAGLGAGGNQLEGVQFALKDEGPLRQKALREAVLEAGGKAQAIAQALGVRIAGVQEVIEGGVSVRPIMLGRELMAPSGAATPVLPGQVTVSAGVTARYRIAR